MTLQCLFDIWVWLFIALEQDLGRYILLLKGFSLSVLNDEKAIIENEQVYKIGTCEYRSSKHMVLYLRSLA